jgi:hypothetical protein
LALQSGTHTRATAPGSFGAGIDDAIIVPLALIALAAKKLLKATLTLLINILDYAFPILLQLARFPLFTLRIIGDGIAALLKGLVRFLPLSGAKREAWRALVSARWSWLRQKISYRAFEQFVHDAFEGGMAWVFRKCRTLTPGSALLVIAGAVLWLPVSFGAATAMHGVLIAKAAAWPAWLQLLHPLATVIAKSKLLVLPAYPAAWPQAKKHPFVQAILQIGRYLAGLRLMQKTAYRFRQMERAAAELGDALQRAACAVGLTYVFKISAAALGGVATWIGTILRVAMTRTVEGLSWLPLIGPIVRRYAAHYEKAAQRPAELLSEKTSKFFQHWSIKFSAEYYEAKEKEEAAKRAAPKG